MKCRCIGLSMIGMFVVTFATTVPASEQSGAVGRWDFDVYLNDKQVGKHNFEVTDVDGITQVQSDADFNYKILFISAYRYEHSNSEQWADNCLVGFDAITNANGKRIQVSGEKVGANFTVINGDTPVVLPECVMSFAYWNPEFLEQSQLLNPQTGAYVDVSVERLAEEVLEVRGRPVMATRFRLTANEVNVMLWYSADKQWLALESVAKGGHIIRYELS